MADFLVENGMVVDARSSASNMKASMVARRKELDPPTLPVIRWLLDQRADIDAGIEEGWAPLGHALWAKNTDVIKELLQQDAKPKVNFLGPVY